MGPVAADGFCRVELPSSWRQALTAGRLSTKVGEDVHVKVASTDGSSYFAQVSRAGWRGMVWYRDGGARQTTVMTLDDPVEEQVAHAGFDGRWLVFAIMHDRRQFHDWTVYAWDSVAGGRPRAIADNRKAIRSPWIRPEVHKGKASWVEGIAAATGVDGPQARVHLYDLASGTDKVVHSAPATEVFFLDSWLVWRAGYEGDPSPLRAVDIDSGDLVDLPPQMREIRSDAHVRGDAGTIAWTRRDGDVPVSADQPPPSRSIVAWRRDWPGHRTIATLPPDEYLEWPEVAGDLVAFVTNDGNAYVADLRHGSYVWLGEEFAFVSLWGDTIMTAYRNQDKAAPARITLVRASELPPLPSCTAS